MPHKAKKGTGDSSPKDVPQAIEASPDRKLEIMIGRKVRQHRKHSGLTVADLAKASDISPGMLSKIENGQISPSLGTLQMLTTTLNLQMSSLFSLSDERQDCSMVKSGEGLVTQRRGSKTGYIYQLLGHTLNGATAVEPYIVTVPKDAGACATCQHDSAAFIYVLSGEMDYSYGDRVHHLKPGDSMLFDGTVAHGPKKLMKAPVTFLSVIVFPRG